MSSVLYTQNLKQEELIDKKNMTENFDFYKEKFLDTKTCKLYPEMNNEEKASLETTVKESYLSWLNIPLDFFEEHKEYLLDGIATWLFNQNFVNYLSEVENRIVLAFKDPLKPLSPTTLDPEIRKENRGVVSSIEKQNDLFTTMLEDYFKTKKEIPFFTKK